MEPLTLIILLIILPTIIYIAYACPIAGPFILIAFFAILLSPIYTFTIPSSSFMTPPSYGYDDNAIYPPGTYLKIPFSKDPIILSTKPVDYTITVTCHTSDNLPFTYSFDILDVSFIPESYQTQFYHNTTNFINYYQPYIQDRANAYFSKVNSHDLYFKTDYHRDQLLKTIERDKKFTTSILSHFTRGDNTPYFFNSRVGLTDQFTHLYIREELPAQFAMADAATNLNNVNDRTTSSKYTDPFPIPNPTVNPNNPQKYGTQEDIDNTVYSIMIEEGRLNADRSMNRTWYAAHPDFYEEYNRENPTTPLTSPKPTSTPTPTKRTPNSIICNKNGYCESSLLQQYLNERVY